MLRMKVFYVGVYWGGGVYWAAWLKISVYKHVVL